MKSRLFKPFIVLLAFAITAAFTYAGRLTNKVLSSFYSGNGTAVAQETGTSKVVFTVKCYDDGKAALRDLKGVQKIETGFHYLNETDTVYFDPKVITVEEMETALKKAGKYVKTGR